jgi:hypothetical protein
VVCLTRVPAITSPRRLEQRAPSCWQAWATPVLESHSADQTITDAIDRHVPAEQDDDGSAGVLARWVNGPEDQPRLGTTKAQTGNLSPDLDLNTWSG